MKISHLRLLMVAGVFLCAAQRLLADVTYYYNSLDSNPYDFTGALTLQSNEAGQPLPFLSFFLSAVINGRTVTFTASDQTGSSEAIYDANPNDPLSVLSSPTYGIVDPVLGGLGLDLGPAVPAPSGSGSPVIDEVPSYPVVIAASDNGVWLQTPPPPPSPVPDAASTIILCAPAMAALCGFARLKRRNPTSSC